jgi:hypothetical protein
MASDNRLFSATPSNVISAERDFGPLVFDSLSSLFQQFFDSETDQGPAPRTYSQQNGQAEHSIPPKMLTG